MKNIKKYINKNSDNNFSILYISILTISYIFLKISNYKNINFNDDILLITTIITFSYIGYKWKNFRILILSTFSSFLLSYYIYNNNINQSKNKFILKYFLSSQPAILWMCILFMISSFLYSFSAIFNKRNISKLGSKITWIAIFTGCTGLIIRWYESYLISSDNGHIPIANLYEVLILFNIITSLIYLYYERYYNTYVLGVFMSLIISINTSFLIYYSIFHNVKEIQPLVPALKSWWIKVHVPASFMGYGNFSISGITSLAYIIKSKNILISNYLPKLEILEEIIYRTIISGFLFFTIAIFLGSLWASNTWGSYWNWDPKETWSLIVWLNYSAWLHAYKNNKIKKNIMIWWSLISILLTTFSFIGVNLFLSSLHSYGSSI